jgi:23S rRNA pseudouridine1911/1915/1917 synthase
MTAPTPPADAALVRVIGPAEAGQRLDKFLVGLAPERSRSALARLVRDGSVLVNGKTPKKPGLVLEAGDTLTIKRWPPEDRSGPDGPMAEDIPLTIVYEDDDLLVVDKPAGLAVHPGPGHVQGTLVNALLAHGSQLSQIGGEERPGIVHRLDKDTSGLLLVAKTDAAHEALAAQFKDRTTEKTYIALVRGGLQPSEGIVEAPIARDPAHRQRMAVVPEGREAVTHYRALAYLDGYTLVEVKPRTGRSHQIRVHFASLRHPVAGDTTYARGAKDPVPRLFLHAHRLRFQHPRTSQPVDLVSPLADDLANSLRRLAKSPEHKDLLARLTATTIE